MKNKIPDFKKYVLLLILLSPALLFIFCKDSDKKNSSIKMTEDTKMNKSDFQFNLEIPDKIIKLPFELQEISSVTYYNENQLICNQDESDDIYIIDYQSEQIIEHIPATQKGDFEDVVVIGSSLYLLKSSGTIIEYENFKQLNSKQIKHKTSLTSGNDAEGLCFDPKSNSLLIACKGKPYISKENSDESVRCVYQFNLSTKLLNEKPFLTIDLKLIKEKFGIESFMPSGIAINPLTGDFYIISAVGKILIVMNEKQEIIYYEHLSNKVFKQPEGICFSPDGKTLFISNEGKNKQANILIFKSK